MAILYQTDDIIKNQYRINGILGKGGVAVTYRAIDLETNSPVAIKVISLKQLNNWKQIELFQREAEVLAKLKHPAIPKYIDYFDIETETDKAFYLVQQLAPGKSLFELVESGWRTNEAEVKKIAQQILEILAYLHSLEPPVIHRDIKPNNLIRSDDGTIYLVDFGAVQNTYYNTLMHGSTVVGTYGYMAPEQFRGKALPATDLYSLGATLLYLLTHRSPSELPQDTLKLDFRSSVNISDSFANWLEKLLEPDLDDRFTNANVALAELFATNKVKQRKLITGVGIGFLCLSLIWGISSYKWFFLSRLGFYPSNICSDASTIEKYLDRGGKVNLFISSSYLKRTSILGCIFGTASIKKQEKKDLINLLIYKGADIDARNNSGKTPLLFAARFLDNYDIIRLLLEHGADVNAKDDDGRTPLFTVSDRRENYNIVKLLLERGADVNAKNEDDLTPLFRVYELKTAKLLLEHGANVNARDKYRKTPLHRIGNKETMKFLIEHDADLEAKDIEGNTPLIEVTKDRYHNDTVKLLIDYGANINSENKKGYTPIINSVKSKNTDIVKLLIERGVNINQPNKDGKTPLFYAFRKEMTELLIKHGANVNIKDRFGRTPLMTANDKFNRDSNITKILIDRGADVNAKDNNGETALFYAVLNNKLDSVKILLANDANPNVKNNRGETPLLIAKRKQNSDSSIVIQKQYSEIVQTIEQVIANQK